MKVQHVKRAMLAAAFTVFLSTLTGCTEPSNAEVRNAEVRKAEDRSSDRASELFATSLDCVDPKLFDEYARRVESHDKRIDRADSNRAKLRAFDKLDDTLDDFEDDLKEYCDNSSRAKTFPQGRGSRPSDAVMLQPQSAEVDKASGPAMDRYFSLFLDPFDVSSCQKPDLKDTYQARLQTYWAIVDDFGSSNTQKMQAIASANATMDDYEAELAEACSRGSMPSDAELDALITDPSDRDVYVNTVALGRRGAQLFSSAQRCTGHELLAKYEARLQEYGEVIDGKPDNRERIRGLIGYSWILNDYTEDLQNNCDRGTNDVSGEDLTTATARVSELFFTNLLCGSKASSRKQSERFTRSMLSIDGNRRSVVITPIDDATLDVYDEELLAACSGSPGGASITPAMPTWVPPNGQYPGLDEEQQRRFDQLRSAAWDCEEHKIMNVYDDQMNSVLRSGRAADDLFGVDDVLRRSESELIVAGCPTN